MATTPLFDLDEQLDPKHAALILVDVQNDFVHPDGWVAQRAIPGYLDSTAVPDTLGHLTELLDVARSADVLRIHLQNIGDAKYLAGPQRAQYRTLMGSDAPACTLEGTWGAEIHEAVLPEQGDRELVVRKHRYSGFAGTDLGVVLRSHGIATLAITGVATSGCVESTARDAFFADYYVVMVEDCCADYDAQRHEYALRKLGLSFGTVVPAERVEKRWRA